MTGGAIGAGTAEASPGWTGASSIRNVKRLQSLRRLWRSPPPKPGAPESSSRSQECPFTSAAGPSRQTNTVPVCIEASQGRVAAEAETIGDTREEGDWAPLGQQDWRTAIRKYALPGQQLLRQSFQSADPFSEALTSGSGYSPSTVGIEVCSPHFNN